jgi:hypothetical protein
MAVVQQTPLWLARHHLHVAHELPAEDVMTAQAILSKSAPASS